VEIKRTGATHSKRHALTDNILQHTQSLCVYADAGVLQPQDWLHDLYSAWCEKTESVCAMRANALSLHFGTGDKVFRYKLFPHDYEHETRLEDLVPIWSYGVLFPPRASEYGLLRDKQFLSVDSDDDMWLWALLRASKIPAHLAPKMLYTLNYLFKQPARQETGSGRLYKNIGDLASYVTPC
jgi:hypothetical protein